MDESNTDFDAVKRHYVDVLHYVDIKRFFFRISY